MSSFDCTGRVALVTGASKGIGAAIAVRLAAAGADVAVVARSMGDGSGSLAATVDVVEALGRRALPLVADLAESSARDGLVSRVERELGPVDILVNNAALAYYGPFEDLEPPELRRLTELDYVAPVELAQAALAGMRERQAGWIVNLSSVVARHQGGPPYDDVLPMYKIGWHYGALKAALERFTTGLASEVYADHVAVNALLPVAGVSTAGFDEVRDRVTARSGLLESVEQMAEAALAHATADPVTMTGRILTSRKVLDELERPIFTLDGSAPLEESPAHPTH
jgi:NAD(P)-dependent dehydrogenase (short-subunit alcohol dehydrogenase family)